MNNTTVAMYQKRFFVYHSSKAVLNSTNLSESSPVAMYNTTVLTDV